MSKNSPQVGEPNVNKSSDLAGRAVDRIISNIVGVRFDTLD